MFTNSMWIQNNYRKIKNPVKYDNTDNHLQSEFDNTYDFKFQKKNYEQITEKTAKYNLYPFEIYASTRANKMMFVIIFNNPNLIWYKYEGTGYGSCQNYIYWKNQKFTVGEFLKFSSSKLDELFLD